MKQEVIIIGNFLPSTPLIDGLQYCFSKAKLCLRNPTYLESWIWLDCAVDAIDNYLNRVRSSV